MNANELKAILLCGGEGLRFKNEHLMSNKVLAEINKKPLLLHIMYHYNQFGIRHFILCVRDDDWEIADYFSRKNFPDDWIIEVIPTGNNTPTGGRILYLKEKIKEQYFFVTYGDGLCDVDIQQLLHSHIEIGCIATLTSVRPLSQYGILNIQEDGIVNSFEEKPQMKDWINGGFFVFENSIFNYLDFDHSLEESLMEHLIPIRQLSAYLHHGFWKSMDTYKEFKELELIMKERKLYKL